MDIDFIEFLVEKAEGFEIAEDRFNNGAIVTPGEYYFHRKDFESTEPMIMRMWEKDAFPLLLNRALRRFLKEIENWNEIEGIQILDAFQDDSVCELYLKNIFEQEKLNEY